MDGHASAKQPSTTVNSTNFASPKSPVETTSFIEPIPSNDGSTLPLNHITSEPLTLSSALRTHPTSILWSLYFSLGIIMLAFDPQLLGNLYATPSFQQTFGYYYAPSKQYIIPARWQTALSMGNPIGQCLGALAAGYPMDKYGRKRTFGVCVIGTAGCIFFQFFAKSLSVLLVGELLGGLILGMYAVIAPAYASEVTPLPLRGIMTGYVNLCFVIGQLIANGVTAGTANLNSEWAYRIPFALQWVWPAIILPILPFAPESPWWLARRGKLDDTRKVLGRLSSRTHVTESDVERTLQTILATDALERDLQEGTRYVDCLMSNVGARRRTMIAVGVYTSQVLSGIYLVNYATYFFERAGLPPSSAFDMSIGFLSVGFVGTVLSWVLLQYVGRRRIFLGGLTALTTLQLIIGILDCIPNLSQNTGVVWAQSSLMVVWNFVYDLTLGPITFVIICEISSTRLREKTIALSTAVQAVLGIVMTVAIPYLINPDQADLRGKLGFFFGGLALCCLVWGWFCVPETAGRSYEEMDVMFERAIGTRAFKTWKTD